MNEAVFETERGQSTRDPRPTPLTAFATRRVDRRRFLRVGVGSIAAGALLARGTGALPASAAGPAGTVALARGREIALVRADGTDDRTILALALGEFVADVALSPDGSRVAFGMFTARAGDGPGGSDIVFAPTDPSAGGRTMVVPRDRPGMLLASPSWAPDGSALVFEGVGLGTDNRPVMTVDWVAVDGSGRRTIAADARYPTISPDGRQVAYVRGQPAGDGLYVRSPDGGPETQIVSEHDFLAIVGPKFSPDGSTIAFSGVPSDPLTSPKVLGPGPISGAPGIRGVARHGIPSDPYLVSPTGANLRRAAQLSVDDLALAWSPDGGSLAISGAAGLYLFELADGSIVQVTQNGSFGAIDWR